MKLDYLMPIMAIALALGAAGCGSSDGSSDFAAGKAAFELRDYKKAERYFLKSVEQMKDDVDVLVYLARTYQELERYPDARHWIEKAEELAAGDQDVKLLGAQIAFHENDLEKARRLFSEIANDAALEAAVRSQGWAGLGVVEMNDKNGEKDLARLGFLQATHIDRRNAAAWYHLGLLYRNAYGNRYNTFALEMLDYYVRIDANASPRVQHTQQVIIPKLKEAIAQATADRPGVGRRNSELCSVALKKAETARKGKNFKQAFKNYQEAYNADVLSFPAAEGMAEATLEADSSKEGRRKALDYYQLACEIRPSSATVLLKAGALAAQLGLHEAAENIYSRALSANPKSIDAIDGFIRAARRCGHGKVANAYQEYRDVLFAKRGGRK